MNKKFVYQVGNNKKVTLPFVDETISLASRVACCNKVSFKMYTLSIILLYLLTLNSILLPQMHLNPTYLTLSVSQELSKLFLNSFIGIVTINFLFVKVYGA